MSQFNTCLRRAGFAQVFGFPEEGTGRSNEPVQGLPEEGRFKILAAPACTGLGEVRIKHAI